MKGLSVYKLNILDILYFMTKCKYRMNPHIFCNFFADRTKIKKVLENENFTGELLCQKHFSQYCILYRGANFRRRISNIKAPIGT